jgi:hypothetical protein
MPRALGANAQRFQALDGVRAMMPKQTETETLLLKVVAGLENGPDHHARQRKHRRRDD